MLHQPTSYASGTARLAGNLRLTGGTIVERLLTSTARTIRLKMEGAYNLNLGDGDSGTIETITLRGNLINSGGPNEAWGFDADTVVDDGGMVLRYVGPAGQNSSDKYSFDWRNSSGTAQAFRGGSAGTIFELGNLPYNGGFVARGAGDTTFTGPVTVMNPYLLTFASNLPNNGVAPTRSQVLLTGSNAGMTIQNTGGRVAAASITVSSGAFLGGNGFYDAPVLVNEGAISPGASVGTMTVSNLTLNASSLLSFELPVKGVTGGGTNDLLVVNGDLVLDGTLETPVRAGAGEYTIIQYSGSLTDNGLDVVNGRVVAGAGKVVVTFNEPGTMIIIR